MGAVKTFLIKNAVASGANFGSLQDGGSLTSATTTTGWNNGILGAGYYASMTYGATSGSWATSPTLPPSYLTNASGSADAWRTESTYTGNFAPGVWTFATSLIAGSAASGSGRLRFRLWRGTDPTGLSAVELTTSVVATTDWSNLTTSTAQNLTGTQSIAGFSLNREYLFWQMAMVTVSANAATSASQMIRVDSSNSRLVTPLFQPVASGSVVTSAMGGSKSSNAALRPAASGSPVGPQTYYQMRGWYAAGSTYESWTAAGSPSYTPPSGHTLTGVVVVAFWTA